MPGKSKYPNIENFNPSVCISRKLMKCNRIVSAVFRKHFQEFDLTNSQISILFIVSKKGIVTQSELLDILSLEKSTVSRSMKRLFQNGCLEKESLKEISMTKKGRDLLEEVIPKWENAMVEIRKKLKKEGEQALNLVLGSLVR